MIAVYSHYRVKKELPLPLPKEMMRLNKTKKNTQLVIDRNKLDIQPNSELGKGNFGRVVLAKLTIGDQTLQVALKMSNNGDIINRR